MAILTPEHPMVNDGLPPVTAASVRAAKDDALAQLRASAQIIAARQGHMLGTWREIGTEDEIAYCRRCGWAAMIDVLRDPHLAGPAVSRTCLRPDAFLANQHAADVNGGRR